MADPQPGDQDQGVTAEFAAVTARDGDSRQSRLPADPRDALRGQLPGLEPDREVTDWGRSQRIEGIADRTIYGFLYHYWFRVEVDGIENVPASGGALLLANRAGSITSDGAMIAKAVRDEHPRRRPVHLATERSFRRVPAIGMLMTKIGAVPAHPANLHRLLFDERELVLAFPEGDGARKALGQRYRLRAFNAELVEAARRARVPIVPLAVLGAEESAPVLTRIPLPRRLPSIPLGGGVPLPAKFKLRFLEAADPGQATPAELAEDLRALIQENVLEMVGARRSVWLG